MSRRACFITPAAQQEIDEHAIFLLQHGPQAAFLQFLRRVYRTARLLASMPYLGQKVEGYDDLRESGVRGARGIRIV